MYRRADVERVLRIKQLVYGEGLTLAGVRRRLVEERPPDRQRIRRWRISPSSSARTRASASCTSSAGFASFRRMLSRPPGTPAAEGDGDFQLRVGAAPKAKAKSKAVATPVKKKR